MSHTEHTPPPSGPGSSKSVSTLLSEVMSHVSGLVRGEINLVRAEVSESMTKAMVGIGMIVAAVVLVLVALNVLAAALVDGIAALGLDAGWAALIVGVVFAVIAAIMLMKGKNDLKSVKLAPSRATRNVQKDAYAVKESLNG